MLRAILNKSWRQHPTRHQLYGHLPPITKTIQVRRTRHAGHCWRSKDELISDVLLWTPVYDQAKVGQPARTYIQQLCEDTGCNPEYLPKTMNGREKWRERVRDIRAGGTTWWWWWWCIWPYQVLPLQSRLNLGAMSMKAYSAFPKAQHYWSFTVKFWKKSYPLCRDTAGVFYNPSRLGCVNEWSPENIWTYIPSKYELFLILIINTKLTACQTV